MLKKVLPLSLILGLRFFGLFIVLPVISIYSLSFHGATPLLVGLVVGGYALFQVLLQIPFGVLSDKIGRKKTILIGLIVFIIGSLVCYVASDIYTLIFGRLLQGAGAIGAVVSAMIADTVNEEKRTKAMAIMGATISLSFTLAMILGPLISNSFGIESLFLLTAILAVLALVVLFVFTPNPPKVSYAFENEESSWMTVLKDKNLQRMNLTNFLQKGLMTLTFMVVPIAFVMGHDFDRSELYLLYIPSALVGILAMAPAAILAEKKGKYKEVLIFGIFFFMLAYILMETHSTTLFIVGVFVFFIGFNAHEPIMQSLASKYAKSHQKGAALGVFNSFGYLGTFIGGVLGGALYQNYGMGAITVFVVTISLMWMVLIYFMPNPARQRNIYINLMEHTGVDFENIKKIHGVLDWHINESEKILILKYNTEEIEEHELKGRLFGNYGN